MKFLLNGHTTEQIAIADRGLNYGDGVFSTLAIYEGKALCWSAHRRRLSENCQAINLPPPNWRLIETEIADLIHHEQRAVLKIIFTRGSGGRGYSYPQATDSAGAPTRILGLFPWPKHPQLNRQNGVILRICHTLISSNPQLAGVKHLNRLEQVLARAEWSDQHIAEGLMFDSTGAVIEGTMSNLFLIQGQQLLTPDLSGAGVAGVMRGQILTLAHKLGFKAKILRLELPDVYQSEAVFICNSLIGIWPVKQIERQNFLMSVKTTKILSELQRMRACSV